MDFITRMKESQLSYLAHKTLQRTWNIEQFRTAGRQICCVISYL